MENMNTEYYFENSHFGGVIRLSDFDTNHFGSRNMAERIASDWNFDRHCKKNEIARNNRMRKEEGLDEQTNI